MNTKATTTKAKAAQQKINSITAKTKAAEQEKNKVLNDIAALTRKSKPRTNSITIAA